MTDIKKNSTEETTAISMEATEEMQKKSVYSHYCYWVHN